MGIRRDITADEARWHAYEGKEIVIPVGTAVDADGNVTGTQDLTEFINGVEFVLAEGMTNEPLIRKTIGDGLTIEDFVAASGDNDAARIVIDTPVDYDDIIANKRGRNEGRRRPDGTYTYYLRELDGYNVLIWGTIPIEPARVPAP